MEVLILSNKVPYPARDGSSLAMRSTVESLRLNGVKCTVLSLNTLKHYREPAEIEAVKPPNLDLHYLKADTNIRALGALKNLIKGDPYHVSRFEQAAYQKLLLRLLRNKTFDFVQIEGLSMGVYLPMLRKHSRAKVILRAHNIEAEIWRRHLAAEKNFLFKWYLKEQVRRLAAFEEALFLQVDGLNFITEADRQKVKPQKPSAAIPTGINLEDYPVQEVNPEFDFAYLASFDWLPNRQGAQWFLDKVWPLIRRENPEASLALGGRDLPAYFKAFEKQGVKLVRQVDNAQHFMQQARVAIVPLLAGSGMRIKIIENMAYRRPMVATSIGAEGINLQAPRQIRIADAAPDFARHCLHLLAHPEERERMAEAAFQHLQEHYLNREIGLKLIDFYRGL